MPPVDTLTEPTATQQTPAPAAAPETVATPQGGGDPGAPAPVTSDILVPKQETQAAPDPGQAADDPFQSLDSVPEGVTPDDWRATLASAFAGGMKASTIRHLAETDPESLVRLTARQPSAGPVGGEAPAAARKAPPAAFTDADLEPILAPLVEGMALGEDQAPAFRQAFSGAMNRAVEAAVARAHQSIEAALAPALSSIGDRVVGMMIDAQKGSLAERFPQVSTKEGVKALKQKMSRLAATGNYTADDFEELVEDAAGLCFGKGPAAARPAASPHRRNGSATAPRSGSAGAVPGSVTPDQWGRRVLDLASEGWTDQQITAERIRLFGR